MSRVRTFASLAVVVAAAACFPGARAPNVAPQRTLEISGAELSSKPPAGAFGVVFAAPRGATVDPTEVTIVWNRPMRPLELAGEESAPPARIVAKDGEVPKGSWRWLGTSALVFVPEKALPRATEYTVTVPGTTKALDGSTLGEDYVFSFETARPRVVHVTPGEGSTHVEPKASFELRFNQPVDLAEVERATSLAAGKTKIGFRVSRPKSDVPMLVRLTPKTPLPLDSKITLTVDAKLRGTEGPLASDAEHTTTVETYGPLAVRSVDCSRTPRKLCLPHGSLHLELSNRVAWKDVKAHVRVEGANVSWSKLYADDERVDWVGLPVDLGPARQYRVVVTAGLRDEYGQVLAKDFVQTITTDDETPTAVVGIRGGNLLEAAKAKGADVPIASVNVDRYDLVSAAVDENDVARFVGAKGTAAKIDIARALPGARVETVRPTTPRNVTFEKKVSIDALLTPKKGRGAFAIGLSRPAGRSVAQSFDLVSVTDLGISARLSRFGSFVHVSRLSDGKPVAGATVVARRSGAEVARATTDGSGFAVFAPDKLAPIDDRGRLDRDLLLFAREGDDWTWKAATDTADRAPTPRMDLAARMSTFGMLFTDRGIYKPGETVRLKGIFRKPLPRGTETPKGRTLTLRASDPEGNPLVEHQVTLGAFGEVAFDVPIPKSVRLGQMHIEAVDPADKKDDRWMPPAAATSVEIAAYRPAEFKVSVEPDRTSYVRGDKATFSARGDYLFGAPMTGGRARYTVTRSRASYRPENTEGLVVDDDAYAWAREDASPRGGKIQSGGGALDGQGRIGGTVSLALPNQSTPEHVTFEAEIEDLSRQTVANRSTVLVHPAEFYVALESPKDYFVAAKAQIRPKVAAVAPDGKRRAGVPITVELVERTWQTVTEATGEWGMHYESRAVDKVVAQCAATTTDTLASCALDLPDAGFYLVRARAKDARGNAVAASYGLYASGEGARVAWPVRDGPALELVTDKPSYEVGDVATILVKSPYNEAEAIVTIERQGVHKQQRTSFRGTMPTIRVPVTADMRPNTFVSVELLKGRTAPVKSTARQDVGAPSYKIGWAEIAVNPESRRLKVDVRPAKKDLRPGEELEVELAVSDRAGKPARADVAFYAVDEGVLMLTDYRTPDPIPVFSQRRALSVAPLESRDSLARLFRVGRGPGEDKGDEGGGGGEEGGQPAREDFRTTAFFQPSVVTGSDGKAKVRFKLPDSLTAYRLMAVATAEDDRFGFGETQVTTSRRLMARPALPRFLRAGDTIDAGVILTSKGLPAQRVDVTLDVKGLRVQGDAKKSVQLAANGSTEVRWRIEAPAAGPVELAFRAETAGAADAVVVKREVHVPAVLEAVSLYGETSSALAEKLGDLSAMRTDAGGLDLRVASTALVGLDGGVEALVEYPYGCTEQLTSKLVPLVALGELAKDYGIALPKDPNAIADDAISRIVAAQRNDGGFGYWPDMPESDTWLTAYTLWGLHLAKERGRPVSPQSLARASNWLRDKIAACGRPVRTVRDRFCSDDDVMLSTQAFVLDVLAMTGKPDAGYMNRLFERRAKMPLFARALLAHAMAISKMRPEDTKELVRDAENYVRVTPAGATIAENVGTRYAPLLDSENRTTAIVLRTLVTVDPGHPLAARLARGLLAARRGGAWRTTQENAWALLALDAYRKAQEKDAPDFDAFVFFGDKEVFRAPFHGRSTKAKSASFTAADIMGRAGESMAFQVKGTGRLFYEARLRYAKKELPEAPLDRGFFVRKLVRSVKPEALSDALRVLPQTSATYANASDLVLVDLLVVTPDPREQVVIDDPLPAGLEPVQANFAITARDLAVTGMGEEGDEDDEEAARDVDARAVGSTFQRSWYHRELRDDRVLTFVDHMGAGMYHYRYLARATTPGKFVVPPTKAECMYEPETFGRTGATTFEVRR